MTDNELLLAIADIMDKKLDAKIQPLENEINYARQFHSIQNGLLVFIPVSNEPSGHACLPILRLPRGC